MPGPNSCHTGSGFGGARSRGQDICRRLRGKRSHGRAACSPLNASWVEAMSLSFAQRSGDPCAFGDSLFTPPRDAGPTGPRAATPAVSSDTDGAVGPARPGGLGEPSPRAFRLLGVQLSFPRRQSSEADSRGSQRPAVRAQAATLVTWRTWWLVPSPRRWDTQETQSLRWMPPKGPLWFPSQVRAGVVCCQPGLPQQPCFREAGRNSAFTCDSRLSSETSRGDWFPSPLQETVCPSPGSEMLAPPSGSL